jgi:hypothetical protein
MLNYLDLEMYPEAADPNVPEMWTRKMQHDLPTEQELQAAEILILAPKMEKALQTLQRLTVTDPDRPLQQESDRGGSR